MSGAEFEVGYKYQDLIAWQKAKALAADIYRSTDPFPKTEIYGLTSQLRRAAVSIASNIGEGQGRLTKGAFSRSSERIAARVRNSAFDRGGPRLFGSRPIQET